MPKNFDRDLAALTSMTVNQLVDKYAAVFGEPTRGRNKAWLVRRIAWRMQAEAGGGLSDRAKARAAELARDADLRVVAPKAKPTDDVEVADERVIRVPADPRLPPVGTVLTRTYKGANIRITVRADGIEYAGTVYPSLSPIYTPHAIR